MAVSDLPVSGPPVPSPAAAAPMAPAALAAPARSDVLVAHQPAFLPWMGYLSRLTDVTRLVVLDQVQFTKGGWQNRNYIRGPHGSAHLLTVPVRHDFGQSLHQVHLTQDAWRARHWRALTERYGRAPYWPDWRDRLQEVYARRWEYLIDIDEALLRLLLDGFGLPVTLVRASTLPVAGRKTALLTDLCRQTGARVLRVGTGGTSYLDAALLKDADIRVEVATYQPPPTSGGSAINPRTGRAVPLSALDALLHHGPGARDLLLSGARLHTWPEVHP
ncbi:WbqC family protein [Planomonospora sp. ID91781]|uniref:WbqC family protein n=1 Tax=Planomonospora sp. ID91781 TaxID=2738135 RepID=UPI001E44C838|nr:WbqC family protein [Planomonospora sp. ID91781]